MKRCVWTLACSVILASSLGCGDAGTEGAGGAGGSTGPGFEDVPEVPVPASPGGNVPARSEIHTTVRRVWHEWHPQVKRVWGTWNNTSSSGLGASTDHPTEEGWSDEVQPLSNLCRVAIEATGVYGRVKLVEQGFPIEPINNQQSVELVLGECVFRLETEGLGGPVYIRRDRHWQLSQLDGGAGDFLLLEGNVQGTLSSSVTTGSSVTATEEFSRSISATVGPPFAMVSGSLGETFSNSITIEESATETFEQTVAGKEGKLTHFQVWELVETYTFSDEDGNPVEHELYEFVEQRFVRRGAATFLQATDFDR